MARTVVLPVVLFVGSALLSFMSLLAAGASVLVGVGLCAYSLMQSRGLAALAPESQSRRSTGISSSMRAGVALVAAPVLTVLLVLAGMSGVFAGH